jgi:D-amino-acid dehydrogenase
MSAPVHGVDAIVVGGGIVGICTAMQLQRSGRAVTVVERGIVGNEASGHNGGVFSVDCLPTGMPSVIRSLPRMLRDPMSPLAIRYSYLPRLTPWLVRFALNSRAKRVEPISVALNSLMAQGIDSYRPLIAGTEAEEILDNRGFLTVYRGQAGFDGASFTRELRTRRGVEYEVLDADGIARLSPILTGRFQRAVYFAHALFTRDPRAFTQALADRFVAEGGKIVQAEVTGFHRQHGAVRGVRTADGTHDAESVVLAAGPWSRQLLRQLGTDVPLDVERGYGIDLPDPGIELEVTTVLADFHVGLHPFRTGLRLTGLDELAGIDAPPNPKLTERVVKAVKTVFPEVNTEGGRPWMRRRPSMPDSLPVIGRAPRHENVYVAFGHGHKGLCLGAITGKLVQELMDGEPSTVDLSPFIPTRFSLRARSAPAVGAATRATA